jgi:hypothetical protein
MIALVGSVVVRREGETAKQTDSEVLEQKIEYFFFDTKFSVL